MQNIMGNGNGEMLHGLYFDTKDVLTVCTIILHLINTIDIYSNMLYTIRVSSLNIKNKMETDS